MFTFFLRIKNSSKENYFTYAMLLHIKKPAFTKNISYQKMIKYKLFIFIGKTNTTLIFIYFFYFLSCKNNFYFVQLLKRLYFQCCYILRHSQTCNNLAISNYFEFFLKDLGVFIILLKKMNEICFQVNSYKKFKINHTFVFF